MNFLSGFRAAACHVAPLYFDTCASLYKAADIIREAARNGASLIVFPEAFLSAFPVWSGIVPAIGAEALFAGMASSSVCIDGPEIAYLCGLARQLGVFISMGVNEAVSVGSRRIWNTNVLIGAEGQVLNRRRKLIAASHEAWTWISGDGSGLHVIETRVGRIGVLMGSENDSALARYALREQGEQVHLSSCPPLQRIGECTIDAGDTGDTARMKDGMHARIVRQAIEGGLFHVVASGFLSSDAIALVSRGEARVRQLLETMPRGVSTIIGPDGGDIGATLCRDEGILYGDIDLGRCGMVLPSAHTHRNGHHDARDEQVEYHASLLAGRGATAGTDRSDGPDKADILSVHDAPRRGAVLMLKGRGVA